jgi:hypothetical protein
MDEEPNMLTIAGGLILGGVGLVAAFFVLDFLIMGLATVWNLITTGRKNG